MNSGKYWFLVCDLNRMFTAVPLIWRNISLLISKIRLFVCKLKKIILHNVHFLAFVLDPSIKRYCKRLILFVYILIFCLYETFSQNIGDYRSAGNGEWSSLSSWQRYNGSDWTTPSAGEGWPGQLDGTGIVTIVNGNIVTVPSGMPDTKLIGNVVVHGSLLIADEYSFKLVTNKLVVTSGLSPPAQIIFGNQSRLQLPANAEIDVGVGGLISTCANANEIQVGSVIFSSCIGGSPDDVSFDQLMASGGTLKAIASSDSPICATYSTTLSGSFSGAAGDPTTYSWSGTGPGGYTFGPSATPNKTLTLNTAGTYLFSLTVTTTISGAQYSNSASTTVIVNSAPEIVVQPVNQQVCSGNQATFIVSANGSLPLTYQWFAGVTAIPGATSDTYTTPAFSGVNPEWYWVRVTNPCGSDESDHNVNVSVYPALVPGAHNVTPLIECNGFNPFELIFTTSIKGGNPPYAYQWKLNGSSISGANSDRYDPPQLLVNGVYNYQCTVTDACGSGFTTEAKTITLIPDPTVSISGPVITCQNESATLTAVIANGTGNYTYKWRSSPTLVNPVWTDITGAIYSTYNPPTTTVGKYYYRVFIDPSHQACNQATSPTFTIEVKPLPLTSSISHY